MARTELVSVRESRWQDSLPLLKQKYEAAMKAGAHATRLFLDFASDYYVAYVEATEIAGTREQASNRVLALNKTIGVDVRSESWISNLRSIGKAAPWLRKHVALLPQSTDSLKLLADARETKSVALLKSGNIGVLSSLTETRAALGKKSRHYVKTNTRYEGTLSFSSEADAARVFADALKTTDATLLLRGNESGKGLRNATKELFTSVSWKKVAGRVIAK